MLFKSPKHLPSHLPRFRCPQEPAVTVDSSHQLLTFLLGVAFLLSVVFHHSHSVSDEPLACSKVTVNAEACECHTPAHLLDRSLVWMQRQLPAVPQPFPCNFQCLEDLIFIIVNKTKIIAVSSVTPYHTLHKNVELCEI